MMHYRNIGKSGLKVSELGLGTWLTFGKSLDLNGIRQCIRIAFDSGINYFDTAEVYENGDAEILLGLALKEYSREKLVISTKIFWGGSHPNASGLSWKHLVEGTKNSLKRLQVDSVDILFCHRRDLNTPLEETLRAINFLIQAGYTYYWGTSEWSAEDIEKAITLSKDLNMPAPITEQPQYNIFVRNRVEKEYLSLYKKHGIGLTTWSPLDLGILTGKYNQGIPAGSRLDVFDKFQNVITTKKIEAVKKIESLGSSIGATSAQLALIWVLGNPNVSSVLLGISNADQLRENLKTLQIREKITPDLREELEKIAPFGQFQ